MENRLPNPLDKPAKMLHSPTFPTERQLPPPKALVSRECRKTRKYSPSAPVCLKPAQEMKTIHFGTAALTLRSRRRPIQSFRKQTERSGMPCSLTPRLPILNRVTRPPHIIRPNSAPSFPAMNRKSLLLTEAHDLRVA